MPLGAVLVATLFWVGSTLAQRADQGKTAANHPRFIDFALIEDAGVNRTSEPVRAEFLLPPGVAPPDAVLLWNTSRGTHVPVQLEASGDLHRLRVLFLATQPAGSRVLYRLYYGGRAEQRKPESRLKVFGEELAWRVENGCLVADFSPNPGTGRSGQLNKIFLKDPGIWLTRERDQSTLHLSPNGAGTEHYVPVNRWNPPEKWSANQGTLSFRLERQGRMPKMPGLWVRVVYELFAESCAVVVEEEIAATEVVGVSLLRVGEFTLAPDPRNPFSHLAWADGPSAFALRPREEVPPLPLDIPWLAFVRANPPVVFASVLEKLECRSTAGSAAQRHPLSQFSGQPPHYFFRVFIGPDRESGSPLLQVPSGSTYYIRHWIFCAANAQDSMERLVQRVSEFGRGIRQPLRISGTGAITSKSEDGHAW